MEVAGRPLQENEPIPRELMAAVTKLIEEGGLEESKIILGWEIDFRRLIAALPDNKFTAWSDELSRMLHVGHTTATELEKNIGRLVHLGRIIPAVNHFLSRLRDLQRRAKTRRIIKLTDDCKKYIALMLRFLGKANKGIDLNLISYRSPNHAYRGDACPFGLGGYTNLGWAWRFYIPIYLRSRASNNLLEHLATIITTWVELLAGRLQRGDCKLSMGDSTTSVGWAKKSNFREDGEDPIQATIRMEVARGNAWRLLEAGVKSYGQWFQGRLNKVSDALSRDNNRSDAELTNILRLFVPEQLPQHFEIVPLPNEISSWLISLLKRLPVKKQLQEVHTRSKLGRGTDGKNIVPPLASPMTSSSTPSPADNESSSSALSPWLCVRDNFRHPVMMPWLRAQSEVPCRIWHRPSGRTTAATQPKTKTESLADFYRGFTGPSATSTPTLSNKRPYPLESCRN